MLKTNGFFSPKYFSDQFAKQAHAAVVHIVSGKGGEVCRLFMSERFEQAKMAVESPFHIDVDVGDVRPIIIVILSAARHDAHAVVYKFIQKFRIQFIEFHREKHAVDATRDELVDVHFEIGIAAADVEKIIVLDALLFQFADELQKHGIGYIVDNYGELVRLIRLHAARRHIGNVFQLFDGGEHFFPRFGAERARVVEHAGNGGNADSRALRDQCSVGFVGFINRFFHFLSFDAAQRDAFYQ